MTQISDISTRISKQYKFKYQTLLSARIDKQDEDDQIPDEIEVYIKLKISQFLPQSDFDNINLPLQLERQMQNQQTNDSGWRFPNIKSLTKYS